MRTLICSLTLLLSAAAAPAQLSLHPGTVHLNGADARIQMLADRAMGTVTLDVTREGTWHTQPSGLAHISHNGEISPRKNGDGYLIFRHNQNEVRVPLSVRNAQRTRPTLFGRDVQSVLSRQGCNSGPCHGAGAGKGGFRLSLRGFDDSLDWERLLRENRSRRIDLRKPEHSLLLTKPALQLAHVGGLKLKPGTEPYNVLRRWVEQGAPPPSPRDPHLTRLEVAPRERTTRVGAPQQIAVTACWSDGTRTDETRWAKFSSADESTAIVDDRGTARLKRPGEAAVTVWYRGMVTFVRLSAPFPSATAKSPWPAPNNFIDRCVDAKLRRLNLRPGPLTDDAAFLRRASLGTTGLLPTPQETDAFVRDTSPHKRSRLIDTLLDSPAFAEFWAYKWSDLLRISRDSMGTRAALGLHHWVKSALAQNMPYDEFARRLITASGTSVENPAVNFYRLGGTPEEHAENFAQFFMGIRVQCAHCHNHPFERWTQTDYYRMAGIFARVQRREVPGGELVLTKSQGDIAHPKTGAPLRPAPFDGPPMPEGTTQDRRRYFAEWLTRPDNPYFARTVVNRVWKQMMGRGLVEPVDEMRLTNPAVNEPLLQALADHFIRSGWNIKALIRTIAASRTYQLSALPHAGNRMDDRFGSRFVPHRLSAETLLDALCTATGSPEKFEGNPAGTRAAALPDVRVRNTFLDTFGRPPRQVICDCERNMESGLSQALHLINGETLQRKINAETGTLHTLLAQNLPPQETTERLTKIALGRSPAPAETAAVLQALKSAAQTAKSPAEAQKTVFADFFWALLTGPEFLFNH